MSIDVTCYCFGKSMQTYHFLKKLCIDNFVCLIVRNKMVHFIQSINTNNNKMESLLLPI
jgi:hypothetical protein